MKWSSGLAVIAILVTACEHPKPPIAARKRELPSALQGLIPHHPRLLIAPDEFAAIAQRMTNSATLRAWAASIRSEADQYLRMPPLTYDLPDGVRLIATSNRVLERVLAFATTFRLTGDRRYVDGAWRELEAAAGFPNWNPRSFIDTAEMTHAFAIGYDWLHGEWTQAQRHTISTAIIELGLKPGLDAYRSTGDIGWWVRAAHNWNQVCNGGMVLGALAIADEYPELAAEIIEAAVRSAPRALAIYDPDGASLEGPAYWTYGTKYSVLMLASLESALGHDFGLSAAAGFLETGSFPIFMAAPSGFMFAFADTDPTHRPASLPLWWLARKTKRQILGRFAFSVATPIPYDLVFARSEDLKPPDLEVLPLDKYWRGLEAVTMRGAWRDRETTFVGFKAGANGVNHGHLDLGMFAIEALGEQWVVELGPDDYNLPEYFGDRRWDYYRTRAEGHNVLVLGPDHGPDQEVRARTRITKFVSTPRRAFAIADLSEAYRSRARSVRRGVAMLDRRDVLVQDEIDAADPVDLWWFAHTRATVDIDRSGRTATLARGGKRLVVRVLAPADASFTVVDALPLPSSPHHPGQDANHDYRKLAIHVVGATKTRIAVVFSTQADAAPTAANISALDSW